MLKLAALAFPPIAAVAFGAIAMVLALLPAHDFETAASSYMGAAIASVVVALPLAWLVARRMLTRREKRLLDAHAGVGR